MGFTGRAPPISDITQDLTPITPAPFASLVDALGRPIPETVVIENQEQLFQLLRQMHTAETGPVRRPVS